LGNILVSRFILRLAKCLPKVIYLLATIKKTGDEGWLIQERWATAGLFSENVL
jgi:hypothetical protein